MAKKSGSSSWLTAVKRAFRSPTKDNIEKYRHENHYQHEQDDHEDQKKREKRRWLFRKPTIYSTDQQKITTKVNNNNNNIDERIEVKDIIITSPGLVAPPPEQRTAAAAATTQTAAEISRLAKAPKTGFVRDYCYAAIVIQAAFRGYLGRRALRALKGVVKLQALVRGQNVRKQAKLTLKCMQALVRVQEQVSHQRARLSLESTRKSMLADISSLLLDYDIPDRLSISREMSSSGVSDWDDCPQTSEDIEAKLLIKREAALKREKALAYASFSNQIRSRGRRKEESEDKTKWLDRWMATKQWESDYNDNSPSAERRDQNITTVHVDTFRPTRPYQAPKAHQTMGPYSGPNIPSSPSPSKPRPLKVRSASPRCQSVAHTPTLAHYGAAMVPNYMAATESARARARPNSTPRQRPSTPERDPLVRSGSSVKKRLSYNSILEPESHLKSPSFKSLQNGYLYGLETLSSCYDESVFGRDVSPCSTTDLRWLK